MMVSKKAQIATEFMFGLGFVMLLFLVILGFYFERQKDSIETETYLELRGECQKISNLISSVYTGGDGTYVDTKLDYVISVSGDGIIIVNPHDVDAEEEIKLAYYNCHDNEAQLDLVLNDNFVFTDYSEVNDCAGPNFNQLLDDIDSDVNLYDIIFLEDSHTEGNLTPLDNFVSEGGIAIISEHVVKGDDNQDPILFGVNLKDNIKKCKNGNEKCNATVIEEDPRFNLSIGTIIKFKDTISIPDANFNNGAGNIKFIANYTDANQLPISKSAIVTWDYGSGQVTFFPDFVELTELDFPLIVVNHIDQSAELRIDLNSEALCTYVSNIAATKFTGDVRIRNRNGGIVIE